MEEEQMPRLENLLNTLSRLTEEAAGHAAAFSHKTSKLEVPEPRPMSPEASDRLLGSTKEEDGQYYLRKLSTLTAQLAEVNARNCGTLEFLDQLL